MMQHGKDMRDASGRSEDRNAAREVMAVMFVLVEKAPGAFTWRLVQNDGVVRALRFQGALPGSLSDVDELYADFRSQFEGCQKPPTQ
jgi:hypothetical protein